MRKAAGVQTPTVEIKLEGDEYLIKTITTFKTSEMKFKLDEEFEENRLDGVAVKVRQQYYFRMCRELFVMFCLQTKVRRDGDALVQEQFGDNPCEIVRKIEDDKLVTVSYSRH